MKIDDKDVKKIFDGFGIDMATLHKVAGLMQNNPQIKELFKKQLQEKGFNKSVEQIYSELNEVLNHGKSPRT